MRTDTGVVPGAHLCLAGDGAVAPELVGLDRLGVALGVGLALERLDRCRFYGSRYRTS